MGKALAQWLRWPLPEIVAETQPVNEKQSARDLL